MTTPTFEDAVSRIVRKDPRFAERAYSFLKDALDFTMQRIEEQENGSQRHVSATLKTPFTNVLWTSARTK